MKIEKFKVLLYLKKSRPDKSGKAPIMGRITVNRSMVQFSCKISCTPDLWNPRESRLNGKSNEAVEVNAKLDKLLLSIHAAFDTLVERKMDFDAEAVKNLFQGSLEIQVTLLGMTDVVCEDLRKRIGIDRAMGTYPAYIYTRRTLAEFIEKEFRTKDIAFGQMTEQFIHDYQSFILDNKGLAIETCRHYLAIVKKVCRVRCQIKVHNCKCSYLLRYFILLLSKILLLIEFCFIISLIFLIFSPCPKYTSLGVRLSNDS